MEDYHAGLRAMGRWTEYCNTERPHSALKYLPPVVYYRGDPEAKLREREARLAAKAAARWGLPLEREPLTLEDVQHEIEAATGERFHYPEKP